MAGLEDQPHRREVAKDKLRGPIGTKHIRACHLYDHDDLEQVGAKSRTGLSDVTVTQREGGNLGECWLNSFFHLDCGPADHDPFDHRADMLCAELSTSKEPSLSHIVSIPRKR